MGRPGFTHSFTFRYTLVITALFVALQVFMAGLVYWMTLSVYQWRVDTTIEDEAESLRSRFVDLSVDEMVAIITLVSEGDTVYMVVEKPS